MEPNSSPSSEVINRPQRPIFAIFEGGGAKGLAHVGAMDAIRDNRLEVIGVAGTSAGALAALLVSLGFDGADVMDPTDPAQHILAPRTPVEILGEAEWRRYRKLKRFGPLSLLGTAVAGVLLGGAASPCNIETLISVVRRLGLFSTDTIRAFVEDLIQRRLETIKTVAGLNREIPQHITFSTLADWPTITPLKIVATDVDRGSLELFDARTTPNVVVAEAVAASIAIPVAFRPAAIPSYRAGRFADGGMVSNLPIWVFAEDKLAYEREHYESPPVPTIGFTLSGLPRDPTTAGDKGFWGERAAYVGSLLQATLQGSQGTARRFLDDVTVIALAPDLKMLDFDKPWEDYDAARQVGREQANRQLGFLLEVKPDRIRAELATIQEMALREVNQVRSAAGKPGVEQLRVNLLEKVGHHSLRVVASVGMESDADDRLLLDLRGRGAARAFRDSDLLIFRMGGRFTKRRAEFMTKYERALVRRSVRSVMCIPIFQDPRDWRLDPEDRAEPHGVLALDSDTDIAEDLRDDHIKRLLTERSNVLYEAVSSELEYG
nr:patatin-like phospholipase family protein [uncultured Brevundimonas sp.]